MIEKENDFEKVIREECKKLREDQEKMKKQLESQGNWYFISTPTIENYNISIPYHYFELFLRY